MKKSITHLMSLFKEPSGQKHHKDSGDPVSLAEVFALTQKPNATASWLAFGGTYPMGVGSAATRSSGLGGGTLRVPADAGAKFLRTDRLLASSVALAWRSPCGQAVHFLYRLNTTGTPETVANHHDALAAYLHRCHDLTLEPPPAPPLLPLNHDPDTWHNPDAEPLPLAHLRKAAVDEDAIPRPTDAPPSAPPMDGPTTEKAATEIVIPNDLLPLPPVAEQFASVLADAARLAQEPALTLPLTRIRTMGQRLADARNAPPLVPLFGCLWETPGIAILVGDTGVGKSVLAAHIAHLITSGATHLLGFPCPERRRLLYYDFELTDRQLEKRFPGFPFTDDLLTADINPDAVDVEAFTVDCIGADLDRTGAHGIILDNITALALKTTADADVSIGIMKGLKRLQQERNVSSLVLAHVPKIPLGAALNLNHLAGSKHLSNFADSVFFISRSIQGPTLRYLKQAKNRTSELLPDVVIFELYQSAAGYLDLRLLGPDEEANHLAPPAEAATGRARKAPPADIAATLGSFLREPLPSGQLEKRLEVHFETSDKTIRKGLKELVETGASVLNHEGQTCKLIQEQTGTSQRYRLALASPTD